MTPREKALSPFRREAKANRYEGEADSHIPVID
jgi:hypothetical protein